MGILMMLILIGFVATFVLASIKFGFGSTKRSTKILHVALIVVCVIITGFTFGYSIHATDMAVGNAEQVGLIKPIRNADSGNVYHDTELDKYFVIQSDVWNPIEPVYRTYLDNEAAEKYANAYESLVGILQESQ